MIALVACAGCGSEAEPSTADEGNATPTALDFVAWFANHVDEVNAAGQHALSTQDALSDFDFAEAQRQAQLSSDAYGKLHDDASANDDGSDLARAVIAATQTCRDAWNGVALSIDLANESQFDLAKSQVDSCVQRIQKIQETTVRSRG